MTDPARTDAEAVDHALARLLREGRARTETVNPDHTVLWDALGDAAAGGKRFRPILVLQAHDAFGGARTDQAVQVGAAIELLHTAFVIHDDVIDGDDIRRGRPNVSGAFRTWAGAQGADDEGAATLSITAGILVGDLALSAAVRAVATTDLPGDLLLTLLDHFDEALHTTAAGEYADVRLSLHLGSGSMAESLRMAQQKTSAYSFSLPLKAGALLAGADQETVRRCGALGRSLGTAFQLVDDLAGVFGDPALTRKSATCDLRTSKQTPLLVHARNTQQWPQIEHYLGRDLDDAELARARHLLTISGSRQFVEDTVHRELALAASEIELLGLPSALPTPVTEGLSLLVDGAAA
ncbi:polyprenyl synthetase family protein [Yimella sp. cx-51]|uniref:polyprenyl synthetase family protein n=1 Tax=Yimella sp. cx-51 TaxID=2770551 RepID=UPI00165E5F20|nr:polyprenyl synthetase family protein [Yimella sp. cx-51]MBC9956457.1 polyprenyl synthetase family protein [Yimella sp. cx-51]QTH38428.1 polyprenyl synthetase family protein [Yimella sp. cx-51]